MSNPIQYVLNQSEEHNSGPQEYSSSSDKNSNSTHSRSKSETSNERNFTRDVLSQPHSVARSSGTGQGSSNSGFKPTPVEYVKCKLKLPEKIINEKGQCLLSSEANRSGH